MSSNPSAHPSFPAFNFQNIVIPPEIENPPSPSTDHSETLSDLYGDEPEVPWVDAISDFVPDVAVDYPETVWFTGLIGYRTCCKTVSRERWSEFEANFEERVLKRWKYEAGLGADPDGRLAHWKVFWLEAEEWDGTALDDLRIRFQEDIKEHILLQRASLNNFVLADEEAVASLLDDDNEEEEDQNIPFIWVAHATPDIVPDTENENPDRYEGHYKIPLDKVGDFWEIVSCKHFDMALFAPDKKGGLGGAGFDTMYR